MPPPARGCLPNGRRGSPVYHSTGNDYLMNSIDFSISGCM